MNLQPNKLGYSKTQRAETVDNSSSRVIETTVSSLPRRSLTLMFLQGGGGGEAENGGEAKRKSRSRERDEKKRSRSREKKRSRSR